MNFTESQPAATSLGHCWLGFVLLILLVVGGLFVWAAMPIRPYHARQDALLQQLRVIAGEVNVYRQESGSLPKSLNSFPSALYCPYPEKGYELLVTHDHPGFLVIANHVSIAENGAHVRYACNQDMQIQEMPPAKDERQSPAAPDQLR